MTNGTGVEGHRPARFGFWIDRNIDVSRSGSGVTFGGGQSNIGASGSTTTATYNSIKVSVFHAVIDTSSWTFK